MQIHLRISARLSLLQKVVNEPFKILGVGAYFLELDQKAKRHITLPLFTSSTSFATIIVDITSLLKSPDADESSIPPHQHPPVLASSAVAQAAPGTMPTRVVSAMTSTIMPPDIHRGIPPHLMDQPVKKQSKWSPEEDALIIELRGGGMKWEDISKRLPGRSAISCRLHYQNYLERRSEWDEERKNKLARLYER